MPEGAAYHRRMPRVSVHMLPRLIAPPTLEGGVAVMIDVLRASTTIVHALAGAAEAVVPCETVDEARRVAAALPDHEVLLGGERGGTRIEGFDLGNSPSVYTSERVAGQTIVFTTSNGTRALRVCETAGRVLIGAFVNRRTLVRVLAGDGRPVHLVCAGTEGHLTAEDILFAGAVADDLLADPDRTRIDVQTQMAIDYYRSRSSDQKTFRETLRDSRGGQNLVRLGFTADIERAAQQDLFDIVPEWFARTNEIRSASDI